jgi:hypothetical protein
VAGELAAPFAGFIIGTIAAIFLWRRNHKLVPPENDNPYPRRHKPGKNAGKGFGVESRIDTRPVVLVPFFSFV